MNSKCSSPHSAFSINFKLCLTPSLLFPATGRAGCSVLYSLYEVQIILDRPASRLAESQLLAQAPETRIEDFAQTFANEIIGKNRDEDRSPRKDRQPPGESRTAGFVQDRTPRHQLGWNTDAEKAQTGFDQNRARDAQNYRDYDRCQRIGQNMLEHHLAVGNAERNGCCHVVQAADF